MDNRRELLSKYTHNNVIAVLFYTLLFVILTFSKCLENWLHLLTIKIQPLNEKLHLLDNYSMFIN